MLKKVKNLYLSNDELMKGGVISLLQESVKAKADFAKLVTEKNHVVTNEVEKLFGGKYDSFIKEFSSKVSNPDPAIMPLQIYRLVKGAEHVAAQLECEPTFLRAMLPRLDEMKLGHVPFKFRLLAKIDEELKDKPNNPLLNAVKQIIEKDKYAKFGAPECNKETSGLISLAMLLNDRKLIDTDWMRSNYLLGYDSEETQEFKRPATLDLVATQVLGLSPGNFVERNAGYLNNSHVRNLEELIRGKLGEAFVNNLKRCFDIKGVYHTPARGHENMQKRLQAESRAEAHNPSSGNYSLAYWVALMSTFQVMRDQASPEEQKRLNSLVGNTINITANMLGMLPLFTIFKNMVEAEQLQVQVAADSKSGDLQASILKSFGGNENQLSELPLAHQNKDKKINSMDLVIFHQVIFGAEKTAQVLQLDARLIQYTVPDFAMSMEAYKIELQKSLLLKNIENRLSSELTLLDEHTKLAFAKSQIDSMPSGVEGKSDFADLVSWMQKNLLIDKNILIADFKNVFSSDQGRVPLNVNKLFSEYREDTDQIPGAFAPVSAQQRGFNQPSQQGYPGDVNRPSARESQEKKSTSTRSSARKAVGTAENADSAELGAISSAPAQSQNRPEKPADIPMTPQSIVNFFYNEEAVDTKKGSAAKGAAASEDQGSKGSRAPTLGGGDDDDG